MVLVIISIYHKKSKRNDHSSKILLIEINIKTKIQL